MVSITFSVSPEVRRMMKEYPEMNWSGYIKNMINQKVTELSWRDSMLKKLKQEQEFDDWAVRIQKSSRTGRLAQLKRKGLI